MNNLIEIIQEFRKKSDSTLELNPFVDGPAYDSIELMLAEIISNQRKILEKS